MLKIESDCYGVLTRRIRCTDVIRPSKVRSRENRGRK